MNDDMSPTELCWQTGDYTDECYCEFCEHSDECSVKIKTDGIIEKKSNIKEQEINPALFIISFYKKYLELNYKYILLQ